jgi:hypothetical protein
MADSKDDKADEPVSGEVVPRSRTLDTISPKTAKELDEYLRAEGAAEVDPDADAYTRIIDQVLSAKSPDVVLTPVEALQARDMVGVPLVFYGFDLNESEYDVGSPFYVSMKCAVAQDGTPAIINCGHKKVIAQCVKLREFDQWPYNVMFRTRGTSKVGGTAMLELVKWEPEGEPPF